VHRESKVEEEAAGPWLTTLLKHPGIILIPIPNTQRQVPQLPPWDHSTCTSLRIWYVQDQGLKLGHQEWVYHQKREGVGRQLMVFKGRYLTAGIGGEPCRQREDLRIRPPVVKQRSMSHRYGSCIVMLHCAVG
jgi:hypothetical protein